MGIAAMDLLVTEEETNIKSSISSTSSSSSAFLPD
jgi:hypothetical protein